MDNSQDPNSSNISSGSNPPAVDPSLSSAADASVPNWPSAFPTSELPTEQTPAPTDTSGLSVDPPPLQSNSKPSDTNPWALSNPISQSTPATNLPASSFPSDPWLTPAQPNIASSVPTTTPSETMPATDPVSSADALPQTETSTFNPSPPSTFPLDPQPTGGNDPSLTNLDNPWNTPAQAPQIEESPQAVQPSWTSIPAEGPVTTQQPPIQDQNNPSPPPIPTDAAPTDLSHLISNNQPESPPAAPETLFVPTNVPQSPEVPNLQIENHKPVPKWLIGLGGALLIVVVGASAYFILGIGKQTETTSLPATTSQETTESKPAVPVSNPSAEPTTESEPASSGNFGDLQGSGGGTTQQGSSAAEILRQRQQQQAQTP